MTAHAGLWGTDSLMTPSGRPVPAGIPFELRVHGTETLATMWTDFDRTGEAPNPGVVGEHGNLSFYADPGVYDLVVGESTLLIQVPIHPDDAGGVDLDDLSPVASSGAAADVEGDWSGVGLASTDVESAISETVSGLAVKADRSELGATIEYEMVETAGPGSDWYVRIPTPLAAATYVAPAPGTWPNGAWNGAIHVDAPTLSSPSWSAVLPTRTPMTFEEATCATIDRADGTTITGVWYDPGSLSASAATVGLAAAEFRVVSDDFAGPQWLGSGPADGAVVLSIVSAWADEMAAKANVADLGTAASADVGDFASAAQGGLADTAVQPADLAAVATTGDYDDLGNKPTIPTSAADVGAVPTTRTINDKALSGDVTLDVRDVGAQRHFVSSTKPDDLEVADGDSWDRDGRYFRRREGVWVEVGRDGLGDQVASLGEAVEDAATKAEVADLSGVTDPAAARTALGLGSSATRAVGTTAGTVAAGDDARIVGAVQSSLVDAAGDLLVGTGDNTVGRMATTTFGRARLADADAAAARTALGSAAAAQGVASLPNVTTEYRTLSGNTAPTTGYILSVGRMVSHPVWLEAGTYNQVAIGINTSGAATVRLGLYPSFGSTLRPDGATLHQEFGVIDMSAPAPGLLALATSLTIPYSGVWHASYLVETCTSAPSVHGWQGNTGVPLLPYRTPQAYGSPFGRSQFIRLNSSVPVTGAMPSTYPASLGADIGMQVLFRCA